MATVRRVTMVDGEEMDQAVDVSTLVAGDHVRVLPGELIPVDGHLLRGQAFVRETAFTGEWIPSRRGPRDRVIAGTLCEDGVLLLEVENAGGRRRIDRLAMLIEQARQSPTSLQRQADRFVAWFLPTVLMVALAAAVFWTLRDGPHAGLMNCLAVLLVACPCAAGLATPLVLWSVIGQLAKRGLVVRSGEAIERLATVDSVIFDKTGTLGDERLKVEAIELPGDIDKRHETLAMIAAVERHSNHPVALALQSLAEHQHGHRLEVTDCQLLPGLGIRGKVRIRNNGAGSEHVHTVTIAREDGPSDESQTSIAVEVDGQCMARFAVHEQLRASAADAVRQLEELGLNVRIMTGDGWSGARHVADLAPTTSSMTPEAKHNAVVALRQGQHAFSKPLFVGDGLNDAAAMSASHASVAIASGSDVAREASLATLHGDDLRVVADAVRLARRAVWAVRTNLFWAVSYNLIGMTLAAIGVLDPVLAAVLMATSSVLVSWRSFRVTDGLPADGWHRLQGSAPHGPPASHQDDRSARGRRVLTDATAMKKSLHWTGMLGQAVLLVIVARLGAVSSLATFMAFGFVTWVALRWWHRMPAWLDMTFAMVTLGGFGMNLGWWADLDFASAVPMASAHGHAAVAANGACCAAAGNVGDALGVMNWMNFGMLLLGVPAMFFARFRNEPWSWRRWCCTGMLVLGVPGMVLGMMGGSILAMQWFAGVEPSTMVVLHYLFMMAGMCLGMLLPHALETLAPIGP